MSLIVFGLNHKSAPVSIREQLAHLNNTMIPGADGFRLEVVPLCTCNRVEIYYSGTEGEAKRSFIELLASKNLKYDSFKEYFYELVEKDCVNHLFSVASGLDSMILGENQILHQIKNSYQEAVRKKLVNKQLHNLFQKTLEVGKKVRSKTEISGNHISIASAAVELAKNTLGFLGSSKALILGAGEMANLVAVHLRERGVNEMFFINRTQKNAVELAERFGGKASSLDRLQDLLVSCDLVISSTSSNEPIIDRNMMERVLEQRNGKALFAMDIAVPRDIDSNCRGLKNLVLYDVDDLKNVVKDNINNRLIEAEKAEEIIENEVEDFLDLTRELLVVPHIKRLKEQAKEQCLIELEKFFAKHPELTPELKQACREYGRQVTAKWLHKEIVNLKEQGAIYAKNLGKASLNLDLNPLEITKLVNHKPRFVDNQQRGVA